MNEQELNECCFEDNSNESGMFTEEYYFELDRADEPYEQHIDWEDQAADDAGVNRFGEI